MRSGGGNSLARRIEDYFNAHMKKTDVPLFKDFDAYSKSLPVRCYINDSSIPEYVQLFKMDYCVQPEDLTEMAEAILDRGTGRERVKYISAPTNCGKTASVLPAFLRSASMSGGGTHYIYMAFDKNNERNFKTNSYAPSSDPWIAETQGAAFMVECVKTLLDHPDDTKRYKIEIEESPELTVGDCREILSKYLKEKLGKNSNIFFHLDEHGNMCDREEGDVAAFTLGAMTALACAAGVNLISTSTERPVLEVEGFSSDLLCRSAFAVPTIDVSQIMSVVPELSIDASNFDDDQHQLLATLKLRLGFKLIEMDLISVLYHRGSRKSTEEFLRIFAESKKGLRTNATTALQQMNSDIIIESFRSVVPISDPAAMRLLYCLEDSDRPDDRQLASVVSLQNKYITASVTSLLEIFDPVIEVYDVGRRLFLNQLIQSPDLLSGSPLKTAYFWTLACQSAYCHRLHFSYFLSYSIHCKELIPGRLFEGTDSSVYNLDFLRHGTIYYADERVGGKPAHPLADLFFITEDDELVLVGIYSGNSVRTLNSERNSLAAWITTEQARVPLYTLRGVVLAPNVNIDSSDVDLVLTLTGRDAVMLLGGLKQILRWLE